jgi:osmotically inducible protein OsmC
MQRSASAQWRGGLKDGKGTISVPSGVLSQTPYSFVTRFENHPGTNPEELIAAAHAACFTMALSAQLVTLKFTPETVSTTAAVTLESLNGAWTISKVHLDVTARVLRISPAEFVVAAESAKKNCPVSRLLNAEITMSARLEPE